MSEETQNQASAPRADKDMGAGAVPEPRARGKKRRKVSYLTINKIDTVDYKEVNILKRFLTDRGKILPARQSGNTAKQQRMIARAIRRARELALLPYVVTEFVPDRREMAMRRDRGGFRGDRERSAPPAASLSAEAPPSAAETKPTE